MPPQKLDGPDLEAITLFMLSQTGASAPGYYASMKVIPSAGEGRRLFEQKGCIGCHAVGGQGGKIAPALDDVGLRRARGVGERRVARVEVGKMADLIGAERAAAGLVYSGDCARADDLAPLIRPSDTLLSEATFGAGPVAPGAQHITSGDVARIAARCGAARILLTHILSTHARNGTLSSARAAFDGPIQLVTEGDRFRI